jgi:hypothetical protein
MDGVGHDLGEPSVQSVDVRGLEFFRLQPGNPGFNLRWPQAADRVISEFLNNPVLREPVPGELSIPD